MQTRAATHALAVFDKFLEAMRGAVEPAGGQPPWAVEPDTALHDAPLAEETDEPTHPGIRLPTESRSPSPFEDSPTSVGAVTLERPWSPAQGFVAEMRVLLKYGHRVQVPSEIEKWLQRHPQDLEGQYEVIEFELEAVDPATGLEDMFGLASRAVDRGEARVAQRLIARLGRDAPSDPRIASLRRRAAESIGTGAED